MCWPSADRRLEVLALDATRYARHPLHAGDRIWPETNCYTDLLVEMAHAMGRSPEAMLAFTLAIDFEGDQWTFFKPSTCDLANLYGWDLQELALWKPLLEHVAEQVERGHIVLVELDAWYLPDTSGAAYRTLHSKTTVGVNMLDVRARRMGYFHNAGYFELEGDDFDELFLRNGAPHERVLPPYAEFVKWRPLFEPPRGAALRDASLASLAHHLARAPRDNPFPRFKTRFAADLDGLMAAGIERFHAYAFATWRQYGACYELAATYLGWLAAQGAQGLDDAAQALREIAEGAKALQFQLARAMARGKPLDLAPLDAMAAAWERALPPLVARHAR